MEHLGHRVMINIAALQTVVDGLNLDSVEHAYKVVKHLKSYTSGVMERNVSVMVFFIIGVRPHQDNAKHPAAHRAATRL